MEWVIRTKNTCYDLEGDGTEPRITCWCESLYIWFMRLWSLAMNIRYGRVLWLCPMTSRYGHEMRPTEPQSHWRE